MKLTVCNCSLLTLYHTTLVKKPSENIVGKGENAGFSHNVFYFIKERNHFYQHLRIMSSANALIEFGQEQDFVDW